jgi:hypothetical protein
VYIEAVAYRVDRWRTTPGGIHDDDGVAVAAGIGAEQLVCPRVESGIVLPVGDDQVLVRVEGERSGAEDPMVFAPREDAPKRTFHVLVGNDE